MLTVKLIGMGAVEAHLRGVAKQAAFADVVASNRAAFGRAMLTVKLIGMGAVEAHLHGAASIAAAPGTIERAEYPMPTIAECRAAARRAAAQSLEPTGRCHWCGEEVGEGRIFCDADCADDHRWYVDARKRNGR